MVGGLQGDSFHFITEIDSSELLKQILAVRDSHGV